MGSLVQTLKDRQLTVKPAFYTGARVSHLNYPQLKGTIEGIDRKLNIFRINWDEPWLAGSIFESFNDLILISESNCVLLEPELQPLLKNEACSRCQGAGFVKVVSKVQQYYNGPLLVCAMCNGSKVISLKAKFKI